MSYEPGALAKVFATELIVCLGYEEKGIVKRNHSTEGNLEILSLARVACRFMLEKWGKLMFFAAKSLTTQAINFALVKSQFIG